MGEGHGDHVGIFPQKQPGLNCLGLAVPVGRVSSEQLLEVARLADTYGNGEIRLTPAQNLKALGSVAGIVGAGGNAGAVCAGFLFRVESLSTEQALLLLGVGVVLVTPLAFLVRFSASTETEERAAMERALADRDALAEVPAPSPAD